MNLPYQSIAIARTGIRWSRRAVRMWGKTSHVDCVSGSYLLRGVALVTHGGPQVTLVRNRSCHLAAAR